jgi:type IV pilus assembly protein PilY1
LILAPSAPISGTAHLQQQTITSTSQATIDGTLTDVRAVSQNAVCYADSSGCSQFGWYFNLTSGNAYPPDPALPQNGNPQYVNNPMVYEQIVFNPTYLPGSGFLVNTIIPPATAATMCFSSQQSGWSMALDLATGGALTRPVWGTSVNYSGGAFAATGTTSLVNSTGGLAASIPSSNTNAINQGANGKPQDHLLYLSSKFTGRRVTWIERR